MDIVLKKKKKKNYPCDEGEETDFRIVACVCTVHYRANVMYDDLDSAAFEGRVYSAMAFGAPGGVRLESGAVSPKPRLRSKFPETWIWQNVETE